MGLHIIKEGDDHDLRSFLVIVMIDGHHGRTRVLSPIAIIDMETVMIDRSHLYFEILYSLMNSL